MSPVEVTRGDLPVVIGLPHTGTDLPPEVAAALNETGLALADTDWHVDRLYADLLPGATFVRATFHRYVIDANRPPDGASLYPGQNTTGLCPTTDFDGRPLYAPGAEPDAAEIERRRLGYHAPYHAALAGEVERLRATHPHVLLFDAHSIRSQIPFLFEGRLPDLNIGTNGGVTCAPELQAICADVAAASPFSAVVNGRFKGGWTTRHYGAPETGRHAIQLEIAQDAYMVESPPWDWAEDKASRLRATLKPMLARLAAALAELEEPR